MILVVRSGLSDLIRHALHLLLKFAFYLSLHHWVFDVCGASFVKEIGMPEQHDLRECHLSLPKFMP